MILNKFIAGIVLTGLICSCSLFRLPNIENSKVILRAPADSIKTYTRTQTFYWYGVEDADGYNLQIVSPRFDSIAEIVLDTNTVNNSFVFTLAPGHYEWGVFAYNSGYSTYQSIFSITIAIDSSNNLNNQKIVLLSPDENSSTNKPYLLFKWSPLSMATYYIIEVRDSSFNYSYLSIKTNYDTISILLPEGKKYQWGVQGHNDLTSTDFSKRSLIVDTVSPGIPVITVPVNDGDTISTSPYLVEWEHSKSSLSAIYDDVYVSTDSLFKNNLHSYNNVRILEQSISDLTSDKYYYARIRSIDDAGNISGYSSTRKFFLLKK
jgi:hypothetical protein